MALHILFAEENPVQGIILKRMLDSNGFTTEWAKNGKLAIEILSRFTPDIIISSVEMTAMDGYEFCKVVKSNDNFRSIPFILCSTLTDPADIIRGIEVGANGYITKPYEEKFLMYRLNSVLNNPLPTPEASEPIRINYAGKDFMIQTDKMHILQLLLSIYENTVKQNKELLSTQIELQHNAHQLVKSLEESERLLNNILPARIADRLKSNGFVEPESFASVSVLFTDFKGFTDVAESMTPKELVDQLDLCFAQFDSIMGMYKLEKMKTIGDSYMAAGGVPIVNFTHPVDSIRAALEIKEFMEMVKSIRIDQGLPYWELRIGIHTGPVVAGVIGNKKFAYDMWGDTVNTASRMESSGAVGKVNISRKTYDLVKDFFYCEPRGKIPAKNKGTIEMFFVEGLHPHLCQEGSKNMPNGRFLELYDALNGKC